MARWTQKLIDAQFEWTNECFRQAVIEAYADIFNQNVEKWHLDHIKGYIKKVDCDYEPGKWRPLVHELYLVNITKLDTNKIELIIEAYDKGKFRRSPTTIDVLLSELFERATNLERSKHEHP